MGPPWSHIFYIGLHKKKHYKFFFSETTRTKALILSIYHHLVDHYQVCSNYAPGAKIGPAMGAHVLHRLT